MLINFLDPETFLHLKETFPKQMERCVPDYPHIAHLPGLTFAYKTRTELTDKLHIRVGYLPDRSGSQPFYRCRFYDVVILSIENQRHRHHEMLDERGCWLSGKGIYSRYSHHYITLGTENTFQERFNLPFVKTGDTFFRIDTWISEYDSEHRYPAALDFITRVII